jgi:hypothetical protein
VLPLIPSLVEKLQSRSEHDRSSSVFAIAHFASDKRTHRELARLQAFQQLIAVWENSSYCGRGLLISALSLIPHSKAFADALEDGKWQGFRFGRHVAVFPCNLGGVAIEPFAVPPPIESTNEVCTLVKQLSSPISIKNAQPALSKLAGENPEAFSGKEVAVFAHEFMGAFVVPTDVRAFIMKLFAKVPLAGAPVRPSLDERKAAEVRAQLHEFLKGGGKLATISGIKVPVVGIGKVKEAGVCADAVEVYLSEEEFATEAKMSKEEFYKLAEEKRAAVRAGLIKN